MDNSDWSDCCSHICTADRLILGIRNSQAIQSFKRHYKLFLLLEMLHISGTVISVIVCNCMSFFVISFVVYISRYIDF